MLDAPFAKTVGIALFCGVVAFSATWVRQRQLPAEDRARRSSMLTPLAAGLTAILGALLGIAVFQGWPA